MTTIGAKPPLPTATGAQDAASAVTQTPAATPARERKGKQQDSDADTPQHKQNQPPEDLSDEFLLRVVRAFSGENGVVVDKKV